MRPKVQRSKKLFLVSLILVYLALGASFYFLVQEGTIEKSEPPIKYTDTKDVASVPLEEVEARTEAAKRAVDLYLMEPNGHMKLGLLVSNGDLETLDSNTNSEALSYYLLWNAEDGNKQSFDRVLDYIEENMLHPEFGYMMWRLNSSGEIESDGANIASDADLRAINALFIAEEKWGDRKYTNMIDTLRNGLERVAITNVANKTMLAPYGGVSGESAWTADVTWLSYMNYEAVRRLSERFGEPWGKVYNNMKHSTLKAQRDIGVYDSAITDEGQYTNAIDGNGYGINSLWMMVRAAESDDEQLRRSAAESLDFYRDNMVINGELFALYSINGDPLEPYDTPWVYALVGRAAVALGDEDFSDSIMEKLFESQEFNESSPVYGAILEGHVNGTKLSQFTQQESILTMMDYVKMREERNKRGGKYE